MDRQYYEQEMTNILNDTDDITVSDYIRNETIMMLINMKNDENIRSMYNLAKKLID